MKPFAVSTAHAGGGPIGLVEEFTLPPARIRADMAVIGSELVGYEIKSPDDTLRRLPHQVAAFGRVFDECWLVVATRHLAAAVDHLPTWWGVVQAECEGGQAQLAVRREASPSPAVEVDVLVRLLWREEVAAAIRAHGEEPNLRYGRGGLWVQLLGCGTETSIRVAVRDALRNRTAWHDATGRRRLMLSPAVAQ